MKNTISMLAMLVFIALAQASFASEGKPVQHFEIADITSLDTAKKTFIDKASELSGFSELDAGELHQIHIITYTLEKSVECFVKKLEGKNQQLAKEIAVLVENIHFNSEHNRKEKTQQHLNRFFNLAAELVSGFKQEKPLYINRSAGKYSPS